MTKNISHIILAGLVSSITLTAPSQAQDFDIVDQFRNTISLVQGGIDDLLDSKTLDGTRMKVGFAFGTTADYRGSNNYSVRMLPILTIEYKDRWVFDNGHFSYTLWHDDHFSVGALASLNFGREERQNEILKGLGDIGDTLDFGGFVKYNNKKKGTLIDLRLRHGLTHGQGFRANLTFGQAFYKKDHLILMGGLRFKYFDRVTMQTNFGITEAQSAASEYGLDAFEAKAGLSEVMTALVAVHNYEEKRLRSMLVLSYGRLLGSAAHSPLSGGNGVSPNFGSANQMILGTAITYTF